MASVKCKTQIEHIVKISKTVWLTDDKDFLAFANIVSNLNINAFNEPRHWREHNLTDVDLLIGIKLAHDAKTWTL